MTTINQDDINRLIDQVVAGFRSPSCQINPARSHRPSRSGRAATLTAPGKLEIRDLPLRTIRPDEILVKVEACGICGTDLHCFKSDPFSLAPVILGHEGTGSVVEVGSEVPPDGVGKPVRVGDKIVTSTFAHSPGCLIARYNPRKANLCDDLRVHGLLPQDPDNPFNGYFAEYLIIQPGASYFVVNDMSVDLRVLIEPAAVVCHALERAKQSGVNLNFRSRVVVQGCGPIGLLMVAVLRTFGVNNIIAIDGNDARLRLAQRLGADLILNFKNFADSSDLAASIRAHTKGLGAHFGFQMTGSPQAFVDLIRCIRRGGAVCDVGHFVDGGTCAINPHHDVCHREITVLGSWVYNSFEYPYAYHFLQRAERMGLPISELITHRFPLARIEEAFAANMRQEGIKIVVECN